MPGGDGTGPDGRGPRTGRKLGNCTQGPNDIQDNRPFRFFRRNGQRRGRGGGRGRF